MLTLRYACRKCQDIQGFWLAFRDVACFDARHMSWSRILRFAKTRQVPVIITDELGEDPMVLVSLDQLEEALDGAVHEPYAPPPASPRATTPNFLPEESSVANAVAEEPIIPPLSVPPEHEIIQEHEIITPHTQMQEAVQTQEVVQTPVVQTPAADASMNLEERFFLEY